jgi:hypothetical protein
MHGRAHGRTHLVDLQPLAVLGGLSGGELSSEPRALAQGFVQLHRTHTTCLGAAAFVCVFVCVLRERAYTQPSARRTHTRRG